MPYPIDAIVETLRRARARLGLSQRELSVSSVVPQGHISRIENGAVDLRVSSLIALARALELELVLVPRRAVPAVRSIAGSEAGGAEDGKLARRIRRELGRLRDAADRLPATKVAAADLAELRRHARELQHYRPALLDARTIRRASDAAEAFARGAGSLDAVRRSVQQLRAMRDALARGQSAPDEAVPVPAYRLGDDDG